MKDIIPQDFVMLEGDSVLTDSRTVAKHFGKRHGYVLDIIRKLLKKLPDSAKPRFRLCHEISRLQNGKPIPYYKMDRDGFVLVAFKFTDEPALTVQLAYIDAFNRMAEFIRAQLASAWVDYNRAYQQHLSDKHEASRHGLGLRVWQDVKPEQLAYLEAIQLQMRLPFPALH